MSAIKTNFQTAAIGRLMLVSVALDAFVLVNALFGAGSPGFNFADIATGSQSATGTAGDFFSFTVGSVGSPVSYQSLSFLSDQCGTTGKIDISRTIGGTPTFTSKASPRQSQTPASPCKPSPRPRGNSTGSPWWEVEPDLIYP